MLLVALFVATASAISSFTNSSNPTTPSAPTITTTSSSSSCALLGLGAEHGCDGGLIPATPADWPTNPTSRPCFSIYPSGIQRQCERPEQPWYTYTAAPFGNPYYDGDEINKNIDGTLIEYCGAQSRSIVSQFLATAPITARPVIPQSTFVTEGFSLSQSESWSAYTPYYYVPEFTFTASKPCCLSCTIFGGDVEIYNWPTPAPSPPISTLINSNGFTFVSPSIYVAFSSLHASDLCGAVGQTYNATTVAFHPTDLSTSRGYHYDTVLYTSFPPRLYDLSMTFTQATFGDQAICTDITQSFYQDLQLGGTSQFPDFTEFSDVAEFTSSFSSTPRWLYHYTVTYNPCSPLLSVPTQIYALNSLWSTCGPGINAFFDPPRTLTPGQGLSTFGPATTSNQMPSNTATTTAEAGSTPISSTASMTNTPLSDPTTSINPPSTTTSYPADPTTSLTLSIVLPESVITVESIQTTLTDDPPPTTSIENPLTPSVSIINGSPSPSPPQTTAVDPQVSATITLAQTTIIADPTSAIIIASQTLNPGGQITYSGTTVSLASNAASLMIGGTTTQIAIPPPPAATSQPFYLVGTQTLLIGGPSITVSGTVYSLPSGGSSIIVDGTAQPISALLSPSSNPIVGSQTLVAGGPAITISGSIVSLETGGASVVVGTETQPLASFLGFSTSTSNGIGGIIVTLGGFNTQSTPTNSYIQVGGTGISNGTTFVGKGYITRGERSIWMIGLGLGVWTFGICIF